MKTIKFLSALISVILLQACTSPSIEKYKDEKPLLQLDKYLNGRLEADGIFTDRSGFVKKRFHVIMICNWENEKGTLDESFTYSDGSKSKRIWKITKKSDTEFTGTAADVVGEAIGHASGNAFQWQYTMALQVDDKTYNVKFDDWMYLMNDKVMLNRSSMSKWGIHLGDVTLSFLK